MITRCPHGIYIGTGMRCMVCEPTEEIAQANEAALGRAAVAFFEGGTDDEQDQANALEIAKWLSDAYRTEPKV